MQVKKSDKREPNLVWRASHFLPFSGKCTTSLMDEIVFGMLGASKVGSYALIWPSNRSESASITAVSARKLSSAQNYAKKHNIPHFYEGYNGVIQNESVDVVYNGLPNAMHGYWNIKALEAGKHVLGEKPFAANEEEAVQVQKVAKRQKRLCIEAFHYCYHPLFEKIQEMVASDEIGTIQEIHTIFKRPFWTTLFSPQDIRMDFSLGGGATMDLGCYCIHAIRHVSKCSRPCVVSAHAIKPSKESSLIDKDMKCQISCETKTQKQPIKAIMDVSLASGFSFNNQITIVGSKGRIDCDNFLFPFWGHKLKVIDEHGNERKLTCYGSGLSTYDYQLAQVVQDVKDYDKGCYKNKRWISYEQDSIDNMYVIDEVYRAANLPIRRPTQST